MPVPDVTVIADYATPLYAGSIILICIVTLDPNVDNHETVTTSWSGPSNITGQRYIVTAVSGSGSIYTSNLTVSSLTDQDDIDVAVVESTLEVNILGAVTTVGIRKMSLT